MSRRPATQSITLVLPQPPPQLGPNARAHWAVRARLTRALRAVAREAAIDRLDALGLGRPRARAAEVTVTLVPAAARRRDRDNILASCKALFDGLADAGVVDDDSALTHQPVVIAEPRRPAHLRVCIEWRTSARLDRGCGRATPQ